ncbi:hypothetical protein RDI58_007019 [Solanum bulbocastanum]|uniref:Uncharacterized protein n=1 Tax=Solanum bulbocastanum TaxID=147425 RepID=A0AAN8U085_SOLBU
MVSLFDFILILLLVTSNNFWASEARPLNILKIHGPDNMATFDWLMLGGIKDGPSPGVGHKFTNSQTLGGIKAGPSPGEGHKVVNGHHQ